MRWKDRWKEYLEGVPEHRRQPAQMDGLSQKKLLKLHCSLAKAESSLAVQLRTGKIGLADFLHHRRVPGYESPACQCLHPRQTAKHVLLFCPRFADSRPDLVARAGTTDFQILTATNKGLKAATKWLMGTGILGQYRLAAELLYQ